MTDVDYSQRFGDTTKATPPNATLGAFVAALALALILGLSAVDIQRPDAPTTGLGQVIHSEIEALDGRGKWGWLFLRQPTRVADAALRQKSRTRPRRLRRAGFAVLSGYLIFLISPDASFSW